jgi:hypothetical protein
LPLPSNKNVCILEWQQAWPQFKEFLPNEVFHLDMPSDKQGVFGSGVYFYVPSKAMMKKPDLQELFKFMAKDSKNHVLLSRPLIDYAQGLVFRQFGRMNVSISEPEKKHSFGNQIDIVWFPGDYAGERVAPCTQEIYHYHEWDDGSVGPDCNHLFFDPHPLQNSNWEQQYYKLQTPNADFLRPFIGDQRVEDDGESGQQGAEPKFSPGSKMEAQDSLEFQQESATEEPKDTAQKDSEVRDRAADDINVVQDSQRLLDNTLEQLPDEAVGGGKLAENEQQPDINKEETPTRTAQTSCEAVVGGKLAEHEQQPDKNKEEVPPTQVLRTSSRGAKQGNQKLRCTVLGIDCPTTPTFAVMGGNVPKRCKEHKEPEMVLKKSRNHQAKRPTLKNKKARLQRVVK